MHRYRGVVAANTLTIGTRGRGSDASTLSKRFSLTLSYGGFPSPPLRLDVTFKSKA